MCLYIFNIFEYFFFSKLCMCWCFASMFQQKCVMVWCLWQTVICSAGTLAYSDNRKSSATCIYVSVTRRAVLWDTERSANTWESEAAGLFLPLKCSLIAEFFFVFFIVNLLFPGICSYHTSEILSVARTRAGLKPQLWINKHGQQD